MRLLATTSAILLLLAPYIVSGQDAFEEDTHYLRNLETPNARDGFNRDPDPEDRDRHDNNFGNDNDDKYGHHPDFDDDDDDDDDDYHGHGHHHDRRHWRWHCYTIKRHGRKKRVCRRIYHHHDHHGRDRDEWTDYKEYDERDKDRGHYN